MRPCALTKQVQEKVCRAIADGQTREVAARLANVSPASLYAWLKQGREDASGPFLEFLEAFRRAEAESEEQMVLAIRLAAVDDWRAAVAWLEKRRPKVWGRDARRLRDLEKKLVELEKGLADRERAGPPRTEGGPSGAPGEGA